MPNRIIRESILSSERMAHLKWPEEVFYRRLMSVVDDYGRFECNPNLLRSRCYPLQTDDVRAADISRWMAACQKAGLILCYAASGKQYLELTRFGQKTRTPSKCPPPSDANICPQMSANDSLRGGVVGVGGEGDSHTHTAGAEPGGREIPDWPTVKAFAHSIGLAEWRAHYWFDEMETCGWLDNKSRPVMRWKAMLNNIKVLWESDGRPMKPPANNGRPNKNPTTSPRNIGTANEGTSSQYRNVGKTPGALPASA